MPNRFRRADTSAAARGSLPRFGAIALSAFLGGLGWAGLPCGHTSSLAAAEPDPAAAREAYGLDRPEKAIDDLGSTDYHIRERAQGWLASQGYDAIEILTAAATHEDLEISQRAQYLLRLLKGKVVDPKKDAQPVQKELENYLSCGEAERRRKLETVARLPAVQALVPLCRLVRFETSSALSKLAAVRAVQLLGSVEPQEFAGLKTAVDETLERSNRPGATWVAWTIETLGRPERLADDATVARFSAAADVELELLALEPRRTRPEVVQQLLRHLADQYRRRGQHDLSRSTLLRAVPIEDDRSPTLALVAKEYLAAEDWAGLGLLLKDYSERISRDAELAYLVAEGLQRQGREDEAVRLATVARGLDPDDLGAHVRRAIELSRRGRGAWSEAEAEIVRKADAPKCDLSVPDDTPKLREALGSYLDQPEASRLAAIEKYTELTTAEQLAAWGRIVRFDPSEACAKQAARFLLEPYFIDDIFKPKYAETLRREIGPPGRVAANWLHAHLEGLDEPAAGAAKFAQFGIEEQARLRTATPAQKLEAAPWVFALARQQYLFLQGTGAGDAAGRLLTQLTENSPPDAAVFRSLFDLLLHEEAYPLLEIAARRAPPEVTAEPIPQYILAKAQRMLGRSDEAERLIVKALSQAQGEKNTHWRMAFELYRRGLLEAAAREYRYLIDLGTASPGDPYVLNAKVRLAELLHDEERHEEAAKLVSEAWAAVQEDPSLKRFIGGGDDENWLPVRRLFFLACREAARKDFAKQRELLLTARKLTPTDADILIMLQRLPDQDAAHKAEVAEWIRTAIEAYRDEVRKEPENATHRNQLAWLASNTTMIHDDVPDSPARRELREEAIRSSEKSLELRPGTAGYLDTLARCRFSAGEYETALRIQEMAVKLEPYSASMVKQRKVFRETVEALKAGGKPPRE